MEMMTGLLTRRSIRQYKNEKISKENIVKILEAAQYAPSAHNRQPWEFLVIDDNEKMAEFRKIQPWTGFVKDADVAVLVCGDMEVAHHRTTDGVTYSYVDIDCSLATQNITLAAHSLGIGSCICGVAPMPEVMGKFSEMFKLPKNIRPFALVALGIPAEEPKQPTDRFSENKIHWQKW